MDNDTQKLLMVVICFSLTTKLFRDINVLMTGIPFILRILLSPINVPILLYLAQLTLFLVNLVGALIIPAYLVKYFIKKGKITIGYDIMRHMFKPQLYSAVLGIVHWALSLLFSGILSVLV